MKPTLQATIDGQHTLTITNENKATADILSLGDNQYHIIRGNKTYRAELLRADFDEKSFAFRINGQEHEVRLSDQYDLLVDRMGLDVSASQKMNDLKAPMPGLVLKVLVEVGQAFEKGTPLVILEAMKMENIIKATGDGVVKGIEVEQGQAVEKGQVLVVNE